MKRRWSITLIALALMAQPVLGQEDSDLLKQTKISGLVIGDAYWMASHHNSDIEDHNGFWFRRIYLTVDHTLNPTWDLRVRFEHNSPGDFESSDKLDPFLKDAYVRWKRSGHSLYLGISGTPIWGVVEPFWGYRSVEKTVLDLQKLGSSRDFGVAFKGRFDEAGKVRYHAMFGTGSGTKGETNKGKKGQLSIGFYPTKSWLIELYGDYEDRPDDTDRAVFQVFTGWQSEQGRVGLQVVRQHRKIEDAESLDLDVVSVFGVWNASPRTAVLARYDRMFDPNPDAAKIAYLPMDPTAKSNLAIFGVDLALHEQVHLIPNAEIVFYDDVDDGPTPDTDVAIRTTLFVTF
jgi:hypothetical protein